MAEGRHGSGSELSEHEYGKCEEGPKLKCNWGGNTHLSIDYVMSVKGQQRYRIKVTQGINSAKTIKKVPETLKVTRQNKTTTDESRKCEGRDLVKKETMIVG